MSDNLKWWALSQPCNKDKEEYTGGESSNNGSSQPVSKTEQPIR